LFPKTLITIIKIASNASSVFDNLVCSITFFSRWLKRKTSDEKRGNPKTQGAQNKDLWWKKWQPQNARGSKQRPPMKKEATLKCKGLKTKVSDEKRGNPKMQGAQNKDLWWKKEATPKCKGFKIKTSDEKRGKNQHARDKSKANLQNQKSGTVSSPKPASPN
jgi:hypothetical protein